MANKIFGLKHRFGDDDPYDFTSVESLDEFKTLVADATSIGVVDLNGKGGRILFGYELFRAIASEVIPPQELRLVLFAVDTDTHHYERLGGAIIAAKGFLDDGNKEQ